MPTATFWSEPTGRSWRSLRRYSRREGAGWTCETGWHQASVRIEDSEAEETSGDLWPHDDPRWPTHCAKGCGYAFLDTDYWQLFANHEYEAKTAAGTVEIGHRFTLHAAPPGAMWDADWMPDRWKGPDGRALTVTLPTGWEWVIDARASNCTLPEDDAHKCWVRHGDPTTGAVTVDKNGLTCAAGGGSIWSGQGTEHEYHGFLTGGVFNP